MTRLSLILCPGPMAMHRSWSSLVTENVWALVYVLDPKSPIMRTTFDALQARLSKALPES